MEKLNKSLQMKFQQYNLDSLENTVGETAFLLEQLEAFGKKKHRWGDQRFDDQRFDMLFY